MFLGMKASVLFFSANRDRTITLNVFLIIVILLMFQTETRQNWREEGKGFIRVCRTCQILIDQGTIGKDENGKVCGPYKISSFKELDPLHHPKVTKARPNPKPKMPSRVKEMLTKGHCMVGTINVSGNYLELNPRDIYTYNPDFPLKIDGIVTRASHAVAIIGYGVRGGEWCYVFQNSHSKGWGEQGIGRVNMNSVTHLVQLIL
jgi:hypothetical protein